MPIYQDSDKAKELFTELWTKMIFETEFGPKIREEGISIKYITKDPDMVMYVDGDGPLYDEAAEAKNALITMTMSSDTVHKFWLKKINLPKAVATRKIKTKGPFNKVLKVLSLLKPGHEIYPGYCEKYNLPTD